MCVIHENKSKINKEILKMNFISTFEELEKLYEEADTKKPGRQKRTAIKERLYDDEAPLGRGELYPSGTRTKADYARSDDVPGWWFQQGGTVDEWRKRVSGKKESLEEAVDDEEIEVVDDEAVEDTEPKQTIIECSKCGALVIVDEVTVDEESDLVNTKDECKFCEEKEGYKIIGSVVPYETAEDDEQLDEAFGANKEDVRWSEIKDKHDFQLVTLADIKKGDRVVVGTKATAKGSLEDRDYVQYVTKVTSDEFNSSAVVLVFSGPRYYKAPADAKCFKIVKAKKKMSEDIADVARKVFDKPASAETQQAWEDELNGEMGEISDKRRAHLEKKFAQQRDWEARHEADAE
jgi:hypothetical protein